MQKLGEASKQFTPSKTFAAAPRMTDFFFLSGLCLLVSVCMQH
jgi:hypothetical protein